MSALDDRVSGDAATLDLPPGIKEYYDTLRDRLLLSSMDSLESLSLVAVTSTTSGEGVSTVATNLAVSLSHHGNVLLVDANIVNPAVHKIFGMNLSPGLAEMLEAGKPVPGTGAAHNLDVLAAGHPNGSIPLMFESAGALCGVLAQFRSDYRFVVFDLPPVNETSASLRLASLVDGVVLVVEAGRSRWESVQKVKKQLLQIRAKLLGVVLNKRRFPIPRFFYRS
jgi:capsular exopolysaccharide synthesis family protein